MVGAIHDERGPGGEGAEPTDDQSIRTVVVRVIGSGAASPAKGLLLPTGLSSSTPEL